MFPQCTSLDLFKSFSQGGERKMLLTTVIVHLSTHWLALVSSSSYSCGSLGFKISKQKLALQLFLKFRLNEYFHIFNSDVHVSISNADNRLPKHTDGRSDPRSDWRNCNRKLRQPEQPCMKVFTIILLCVFFRWFIIGKKNRGIYDRSWIKMFNPTLKNQIWSADRYWGFHTAAAAMAVGQWDTCRNSLWTEKHLHWSREKTFKAECLGTEMYEVTTTMKVDDPDKTL